MDKLDGVTALALIVIASFAIDRTVTGALFVLSLSGAWNRRFPDPASLDVDTERRRAEKKYKVIYFFLAGIVGIVVLAGLGKVRILSAVLHSTNPNSPTVDPILDTIVTGLVLVGGADRLAQILKMPGAGGGEKPEPKPVQITGKLIIEDEGGKKVASGAVSKGEVA